MPDSPLPPHGASKPARLTSATPWGVEARPIEIETDVCLGVEAVEHLPGTSPIAATAVPRIDEPSDRRFDLAEVRGQEPAKRALEVAAAGAHNLLMIGPPGSGMTMLARRLPGILPPLTDAEALAVRVHSLVAQDPPQGLIRDRPFRCPHPGASMAGLIGGGRIPRPGEVSLAHGGVLFLDELPEFRRDALDALRQPLEEGEVTVVRARARFTFPARFALLAAMAACPCGHYVDPRHECRCPRHLLDRYRSRICSEAKAEGRLWQCLACEPYN